MPELPEVETTKRGIAPHLLGQTICAARVRTARLRWPLDDLARLLPGLQIEAVNRRAKYLVLHTNQGNLIIHLGMSGHLRLVDSDVPAAKHDHIDLVLSNGLVLRYHDPRKFGAWLWSEAPAEQHPLLASLGPEPLSEAFNGAYWWQTCQARKSPIKTLLMNNHAVVGVGNIYANEALFLSQIHPFRPAHSLSREACDTLVAQVKDVLGRAIEQGGTSLKDFFAPSGKPGYFSQALFVYDRGGKPCLRCGQLIERHVLQQRACYVCSHCQPIKEGASAY